MFTFSTAITSCSHNASTLTHDFSQKGMVSCQSIMTIIIIIIIIICYIYIVIFLGLQSASHMEGGNLLNHHQCAASTRMM